MFFSSLMSAIAPIIPEKRIFVTWQLPNDIRMAILVTITTLFALVFISNRLIQESCHSPDFAAPPTCFARLDQSHFQ
jgi:hypothetical protein